MQIGVVLLIQISLNDIRCQVLRLLSDSARSGHIELAEPAILHLLLLALALLPSNRWQAALVGWSIVVEVGEAVAASAASSSFEIEAVSVLIWRPVCLWWLLVMARAIRLLSHK